MEQKVEDTLKPDTTAPIGTWPYYGYKDSVERIVSPQFAQLCGRQSDGFHYDDEMLVTPHGLVWHRQIHATTGSSKGRHFFRAQHSSWLYTRETAALLTNVLVLADRFAQDVNDGAVKIRKRTIRAVDDPRWHEPYTDKVRADMAEYEARLLHAIKGGE